MSQQGRWPKGKDTIPELEHKPGECMANYFLIFYNEEGLVHFRMSK